MPTATIILEREVIQNCSIEVKVSQKLAKGDHYNLLTWAKTINIDGQIEKQEPKIENSFTERWTVYDVETPHA